MGIRTPFDIMGTMGNYKYFPFVFTIDTTLNTNNPSDTTFIIPFKAGTYSTLVGKPVGINWGDGVYTIIEDGIFNQANCTHTYSTAGVHRISIISAGYYAPQFSFYDNYASVNNNNLKLTKTETGLIPFISTSGTELTTAGYIFKNCTNLSSITARLFENLDIVQDNAFQNTFENCTSLISLPAGLFKKNIAVRSHAFDSTFKGCTNLTSLPDTLFRFNSGVTDYAFYSTFEGCNGLTTLPAELFVYTTNTTTHAFDRTFANCINLATLPNNLFITSTSYSYKETFIGCTKLVINPYIFGTYNTDPTIKTTKFNHDIQYDFTSMFERDSYTTNISSGTAPDLWNWTYQQTPLSEDCFAGIGNTGLINYKQIPVSWGGPPTYTLTINPTPSNASVVLTAEGYTQSGNTITVHSGTVVTYTVSYSHYDTKSASITITENTTLNISLDKTLYSFSISPSPGDATVILTASGYTQTGNTIKVPYDTVVSYSVARAHYISQTGTYTVRSSYEQAISLTKETYSFSITALPTGCTVTINGEEKTSATFQYNDTVSWVVSKSGYITQSNQFAIDQNTALNITLEVKMVTLTINPTPSDATVYIDGIERTSITVQQGTVIVYSVSKEGYFADGDTITLMESATLDVELEKAYTYTFVTNPSDATITITIEGETIPLSTKSINLPKDTECTWEVIGTDKISKSGTLTTGAYDLSIPIALYSNTVSYKINPTPIDATVTFTTTETVPSAYTQKDYITFTGTQYFNTNYTPNTNTRIIAKVMTDSYENSGAIFGVDGTYPYYCEMNSTGFDFTYGSEIYKASIARTTFLKGILFNIDCNKNTICAAEFYNTTSESIFTQNNTFTASNTLYIGAINNNGYTEAFTGKIYNFKIYENDTLTKNYIPCIRNSDNVAGLYETVTGNFITPNTAVTANMIFPDTYQAVEYIQSSGTQYIQLSFGFDNTDEVYTEFNIATSQTNDKYMISPQSWNTNNNRFAMGVHNSVFTCGYGSTSTGNTALSPATVTDGNFHKWQYKDKTYTITDLNISKDCSSITWGSTTANLKLFYGYNSNTTGAIKSYRHIKGGSLVCDLIPCYRISDSVAGMFDLVHEQFYTNDGTGSFSIGEKSTSNNKIYVISGSTIDWDVSRAGFTPQSGTVTVTNNTEASVTLIEHSYVDIVDYTYIESASGTTITKYTGSGTNIVAPYLEGGSS